jgi:hypothetical protein
MFPAIVIIPRGKPSHSFVIDFAICSTYEESDMSCPSLSVNNVQASSSEIGFTLILCWVTIYRKTFYDWVVRISLHPLAWIGIPSFCGSKAIHKSSKTKTHVRDKMFPSKPFFYFGKKKIKKTKVVNKTQSPSFFKNN